MEVKQNNGKEQKKGFWAGLFAKLDQKMEEKAKSGGCCCCSGDKKDKKC
jgi:hypothetical protein